MNIYIKSNSKNSKKINWYNVHKTVFKLQIRIVKQLKKKNFREVRNLQRLLLKSFGSRLLISQKLISKSNLSKFNTYKRNKSNLFLNSLNLNNFIQIQNYDAANKNLQNPSKLLYFQFLQLLWILALLPINETLSDALSYNYRIYRTEVDILKELYFTFNLTDYKWLMILKPTGFFKKENKEWIAKNALLEKKFLEFSLESEKFATFYIKYYNHKEVIETKKISLIKLIRNYCFYDFSEFKKQNLEEIASYTLNNDALFSVPVIFYSDLIFIPGTNLVNLKIFYKLIFQFLNQRGLVVNKKRFWINNLLYGFNFLGWSLKKNKGRVSIKVSRENIKSHQLSIKKFLKSARFLPIDKVIIKLNKKIISWQYYYSYTPNLYETWSEMNYYLFCQVWRWCKKRHKNKGTKWLYNRYWSYNENYNKKKKWVFHANKQYLKRYKLKPTEFIPLPGSINVYEIKNWKTNQNILLMRMANMKKF